MATNHEMLSKLQQAGESGVDLSSPKAFVTHLLGCGDMEAVLWFYKPNSVEFDFDKYKKLTAQVTAN
ncbi:hypothetical protein [Planococcus sp. ISL-109]|uniref:hypothetical protein n=1 Tax=Planococcus sp. ISL-109 TaxID=2819166 RepID=UPI001BE5D0C6|nr:hypothetical protein [Planococcus sp. ISL-109]MBT2582090.1 hypothetical protein [Planococcus sp. ISL-109]